MTVESWQDALLGGRQRSPSADSGRGHLCGRPAEATTDERRIFRSPAARVSVSPPPLRSAISVEDLIGDINAGKRSAQSVRLAGSSGGAWGARTSPLYHPPSRGRSGSPNCSKWTPPPASPREHQIQTSPGRNLKVARGPASPGGYSQLYDSSKAHTWHHSVLDQHKPKGRPATAAAARRTRSPSPQGSVPSGGSRPPFRPSSTSPANPRGNGRWPPRRAPQDDSGDHHLSPRGPQNSTARPSRSYQELFDTIWEQTRHKDAQRKAQIEQYVASPPSNLRRGDHQSPSRGGQMSSISRAQAEKRVQELSPKKQAVVHSMARELWPDPQGGSDSSLSLEQSAIEPADNHYHHQEEEDGRQKDNGEDGDAEGEQDSSLADTASSLKDVLQTVARGGVGAAGSPALHKLLSVLAANAAKQSQLGQQRDGPAEDSPATALPSKAGESSSSLQEGASNKEETDAPVSVHANNLFDSNSPRPSPRPFLMKRISEAGRGNKVDKGERQAEAVPIFDPETQELLALMNRLSAAEKVESAVQTDDVSERRSSASTETRSVAVGTATEDQWIRCPCCEARWNESRKKQMREGPHASAMVETGEEEKAVAQASRAEADDDEVVAINKAGGDDEAAPAVCVSVVCHPAESEKPPAQRDDRTRSPGRQTSADLSAEESIEEDDEVIDGVRESLQTVGGRPVFDLQTVTDVETLQRASVAHQPPSSDHPRPFSHLIAAALSAERDRRLTMPETQRPLHGDAKLPQQHSGAASPVVCLSVSSSEAPDPLHPNDSVEQEDEGRVDADDEAGGGSERVPPSEVMYSLTSLEQSSGADFSMAGSDALAGLGAGPKPSPRPSSAAGQLHIGFEDSESEGEDLSDGSPQGHRLVPSPETISSEGETELALTRPSPRHARKPPRSPSPSYSAPVDLGGYPAWHAQAQLVQFGFHANAAPWIPINDGPLPAGPAAEQPDASSSPGGSAGPPIEPAGVAAPRQPRHGRSISVEDEVPIQPLGLRGPSPSGRDQQSRPGKRTSPVGKVKNFFTGKAFRKRRTSSDFP